MNIPTEYKDPAQIKLVDDTLIYEGVITDLMVLQALELARTSDKKITKLHIDSGGGSARAGIIFGRWVFQNKIKVTIDNLCYSSCANYIFTAADHLHINKNALIGWHGGAYQKYFRVSMRWYEHVIVNREAQKQAYQALKRIPWKKEETEFFKAINVDPQITTYGQQRQYNCQYLTRANGWNYSLIDLKKMGLTNITMEDEDFVLKDSKNTLTSCRITLEKS